MALSKSRTRNQKTLNNLAFQLTEVNGELEFLAGLRPRCKDRQAQVEARRAELQQLRASFFTVIKLYRDDLDPETLGSTFKWMKPYGRKATKQTLSRYFHQLRCHVGLEDVIAREGNAIGGARGTPS